MRDLWTDDYIREVWVAKSKPPSGHIGLLLDTLQELRQCRSHGSPTLAGVDVREEVCMQSFSRVLVEKQPRVVTLIAHSAGDLIEFRDRLWPAESVADVFGNVAFAGTIDLTICNCWKLHDLIRTRLGVAPRIISNRNTAWLGLRIAALRLTIRLLDSRAPISYIDAYSEAWSRIRKAAAQ